MSSYTGMNPGCTFLVVQKAYLTCILFYTLFSKNQLNKLGPCGFFFCHCRTLSALAHWAAIFGEVDYLALLSFPFVKLFQNNQLICFEMIATILSKLQKKKSTNFLDALFVFVVGWAVEGNTFTHRVRSTNMVLRSWTMLLLPLHEWLIASGTSKK